jgi:hypothetical protein
MYSKGLEQSLAQKGSCDRCFHYCECYLGTKAELG